MKRSNQEKRLIFTRTNSKVKNKKYASSDKDSFAVFSRFKSIDNLKREPAKHVQQTRKHSCGVYGVCFVQTVRFVDRYISRQNCSCVLS